MGPGSAPISFSPLRQSWPGGGGERGPEVAWVAGEQSLPEALGMKAVPRAGQRPRKDKVLGGQALGG